MSIVHVSINGTSIQTSNFIVSAIDDENAPSTAFDAQDVALRDGQRLVSTRFQPKNITISGRVKGSSMSNLETLVDTFKQTVNIYLGRLDIEYAGGVRRFIASTQSVAIRRGPGQLTFAPFSVTFLVADTPMGLKAQSLGGNLTIDQALSVTAKTSQAIEATVTFDGSANPTPKTIFILDRANNVATISEQVVGQKSVITAGTAFSSGDELVFDSERQQVLLNGFPINFSGVFPEYQAGINKTLTTIGQRGYNSVIDFQQNTIDEFVTIKNSEFWVGQGILSYSGTSRWMSGAEIYMKRSVGCTTGTIRLRISDDGNGASFYTSGEFRGPYPGSNYISACTVSIDVTDIPLEGGMVRFKFSSNVQKSDPTNPLKVFMNMVVDASNLNGEVYIGISRNDTYSYTSHASYLRYKYSLNSGATWRSNDKDLVFRILAPAENSGGSLISEWSVDKKITSTPRYL